MRRKILRLYFSSDTNSNQHSSPLNRNAPACRDAKSCVSRAMTVYHHRHIITHTHCTYLLVRRKILRLYFSSDTNSNQHSSPLNRNAPACRDAKSCVSRATHRKHKQSTTHRFKAHFLLVRRKILRLYFSKQRILICTLHPIPTPSPRNAMTDSTYRQPPHGGFAMKPCRAAVAMLSRMKRTAGAGMTHIPAVRQLRLSVSG